MKWLSVTQAAQLAGVSRASVYQAIAEGRLQSSEFMGKTAVHDTALARWMESPRFKARGSKWMRAQKPAASPSAAGQAPAAGPSPGAGAALAKQTGRRLK